MDVEPVSRRDAALMDAVAYAIYTRMPIPVRQEVLRDMSPLEREEVELALYRHRARMNGDAVTEADYSHPIRFTT